MLTFLFDEVILGIPGLPSLQDKASLWGVGEAGKRVKSGDLMYNTGLVFIILYYITEICQETKTCVPTKKKI